MAGNTNTLPPAVQAGQNQQQNNQPTNNPGNNQNQQQQQTPPANQQAGQNQQQQQGQFIVSQEQFNQRWAEKMTALENELGMPLKDLKALAEKNKPKPAGSGDKLQGADLKIVKMEALMTQGVPSAKIPKLIKRVTGVTRDEIEADIAEMKADGFLNFEPPPDPNAAKPQQQNQQQTQKFQSAQGAGNPGVSGQQQQPTLDQQIEAAYQLAAKTGRPQDWERHTYLMLQKQKCI